MRRPPQLLLALAVLALVASGCGSKSSGGGLDTALSYVPKDAPLVVVVDTDPDGEQYQQVKKLIGKFPGGGSAIQGFKNGFNNSSGLDYEKDLKPLLGNDFVIAVASADALQGGFQSSTPFVVAWKVEDEDAAKRLIEKNGATKAGKIDGSDYYSSGPDTVSIVRDGAIVAAETKASLEAALDRADGDDHMTEDDFNSALGDLDKDGLLRVVGDFEAILASSPEAEAAADKVKWVGALRTFGVTLSAESDGIEWAFRANTEGELTDKDLPLAAGEESAPVVKRAGEVGIGLRNPAQIVTFGEAAAQVTDPEGYAKYQAEKAKVNRQLGIDVDRDLIGQLTGNSAISIALNGDFAARADLKDPAAAEATLEKAAPRLQKLAKDKPLGLVTPKDGKGFYAIAKPNGDKVVFGVVGKTFVVATDAARAAQFAGQSPSVEPGAKGSLVVSSDARALANAVAEQQGRGVAARIVTGALGDLIGSVDTELDGITANFKLEIK
jgi:hypothetical protein